MRSYQVLVGGSEQDGDGWVYAPRIGALLTDPLGVGRLTLQHENGTDDQGDDRLAGRVALATKQQRQEALTLARAAQPAWAKVPLADRLSLISEVHRELSRRADEFIDLLVDEGHPVLLARWELSGMLAAVHPDSVRLAVQMATHEAVIGGRSVRFQYQPDGVVCFSPPQNAAASCSTLGLWALAGGNAVVIGVPRSCPLGVTFLYQEIVAPLLAEAGAGPGVLSVVCGLTRVMLKEWLASPDVDDIFYFGSSERGMRLAEECQAVRKKPVLELSGNDGVLVWRDAEVELAAQALAECFYGSGQICMVPRYAVVHPSIADELLEAVTALAKAMRPGLPEEPDVVLSPVFKAPKFIEALQQAAAVGAEVVTGGAIVNRHGRPDAGGMFIEPTILRIEGLAKAKALPAVHAETFFPLLSVVVLDDQDGDDDEQLLSAAFGFLNGNPYGLRNSLWARDEKVVERFCTEVHNGGIMKVNDSHIAFAPVLPTHGGTGLTGGPFGGVAIPLFRTSRLQAICDASWVMPRTAVFNR